MLIKIVLLQYMIKYGVYDQLLKGWGSVQVLIELLMESLGKSLIEI